MSENNHHFQTSLSIGRLEKASLRSQTFCQTEKRSNTSPRSWKPDQVTEVPRRLFERKKFGTEKFEMNTVEKFMKKHRGEVGACSLLGD